MARNATHRNRNRTSQPYLCVALLTCVLAVLPTQAPAAPVAPPAEAVAQSEPDWFWLTMYGVFFRLEQILTGEASQTLGSSEATESGALSQAAALSASFYNDGLKSGLTSSEISDGLADVAEARSNIVTTPEFCLDPYWDTFLDTLDDMESALRSAASVRRSGA